MHDEAATAALAASLARAAHGGLLMTLSGPLAAGKTTFSRGFLRALGVTGAVKSPTFTLVESYELAVFTLHHFDLYRLGDPRELHYFGFDDYLRSDTVCLVEWPERGGDVLPQPDLALRLEPLGDEVRRWTLTAQSPAGAALLQSLTGPTDSLPSA